VQHPSAPIVGAASWAGLADSGGNRGKPTRAMGAPSGLASLYSSESRDGPSEIEGQFRHLGSTAGTDELTILYDALADDGLQSRDVAGPARSPVHLGGTEAALADELGARRDTGGSSSSALLSGIAPPGLPLSRGGQLSRAQMDSVPLQEPADVAALGQHGAAVALELAPGLGDSEAVQGGVLHGDAAVDQPAESEAVQGVLQGRAAVEQADLRELLFDRALALGLAGLTLLMIALGEPISRVSQHAEDWAFEHGWQVAAVACFGWALLPWALGLARSSSRAVQGFLMLDLPSEVRSHIHLGQRLCRESEV
jgi:hypothetical protein